jgi:hypothetical protein
MDNWQRHQTLAISFSFFITLTRSLNLVFDPIDIHFLKNSGIAFIDQGMEEYTSSIFWTAGILTSLLNKGPKLHIKLAHYYSIASSKVIKISYRISIHSLFFKKLFII